MNFNYFISEEVFQYILEAVDMVAREGWALLPEYKFCPMSGQWRHSQPRNSSVMRLSELRYRGGRMSYPARRMTAPEWILPDYLEEASRILETARSNINEARRQAESPDLNESFQRLRWFVLPTEATSLSAK